MAVVAACPGRLLDSVDGVAGEVVAVALSLSVIVLLLAVFVLVGRPDDISDGAVIEGCGCAAVLILGCVLFAWYASAHHW